MSEGVRYLHEHHPPIVHSDIKGLNILISDDGHCRITDFGLSTIEDDSPEGRVQQATSQAANRGSVPWLAPELMNPDNVETPNRTTRDIYALGCTIHELLTGNTPFCEKKMDFQIIMAVLNGSRPTRPECCPDPLWKIMKGCWEEDTAMRPSASGVASSLRKMDIGKSSQVTTITMTSVTAATTNSNNGENMPIFLSRRSVDPDAAGALDDDASLKTGELEELLQQFTDFPDLSAPPNSITFSTPDPNTKKQVKGCKGLPSLDALAARLRPKVPTQELSIEGSLQPPNLPTSAAAKTPDLQMKVPEHPLQHPSTIFHDTRAKFPAFNSVRSSASAIPDGQSSLETEGTPGQDSNYREKGLGGGDTLEFDMMPPAGTDPSMAPATLEGSQQDGMLQHVEDAVPSKAGRMSWGARRRFQGVRDSPSSTTPTVPRAIMIGNPEQLSVSELNSYKLPTPVTWPAITFVDGPHAIA
ncbi:hypothetical protein V5O48_011655 [Marasmius crinis-equi]|uniref:Protein kinase domain-containing protein n=1 Tax=Marasmius crinis-equi TaxID=585013 RepID=A0ABR3F519_9AGAR